MATQGYRLSKLHVCVMLKPWMWTIHGLCCLKHGSALAWTIYALLAQSIDHTKWKAQSMDLDNLVILTYAIWQAVWASRSCRHEAIQSPITAKPGRSFSDRKVRKIHCLKDGSSFKLVQTVAISWSEIQVQHNFIVTAKATSSIYAQNLASALCVISWPYTLSYDQF